MRRVMWVLVATLVAGVCGQVAAQCTQLSGTIERDGKSLTFHWDGTEIVVKDGEREVSRTPAPLASDRSGTVFQIPDEDGKAMASLSLFGNDILSLRVTPHRRARASLDVSVEPPSEALAEHLEVAPGEVLLVRSVEDGGAAAKAGLRRFDVIVALDGERKVDQDKLRRVLSAKRAGEAITLTILRRGEEQTLTVPLGAAKDAFATQGDWSNLLQTYAATPRYFGEDYLKWNDAVRNGQVKYLTQPDVATRFHSGVYDKLLQNWVTTPSTPDATETLSTIQKRLAEIEQKLERLLKKPGVEAR